MEGKERNKYSIKSGSFEVTPDGGCLGANCPLNIHISSFEFKNDMFNGYYKATYPAKRGLSEMTSFVSVDSRSLNSEAKFTCFSIDA